MGLFAVDFAASAVAELAGLKAHARGTVLAQVRACLTHEPHVPSTHRKPLADKLPKRWRGMGLWQLGVGEYRVLYTVDERARSVLVRAIRHKGRKRTKEIL